VSNSLPEKHMPFAFMEANLRTNEVWKIELDCGHTIETAGFSENEKKSGWLFCPLESLIKPAKILKMAKVYIK
jgi:hypothetical protein